MTLVQSRYVVLVIVAWNLAVLWLINSAPSTVSLVSQSPSPAHLLPHTGSSSTKDVHTWLQSKDNLPPIPPPTAQSVKPALRSAMTQAVSKASAEVDSGFGDVTKALENLDNTIRKFPRQTSAAAAVTTTASSKQTLFLPIGPNDYERFENLYKSMVKFFSFEEVEEWIIVTPSRESEIVHKIIKLTTGHSHLIRIVEDHEAVPKLRELPTSGWMTQQVIKLGAADLVKTRFYFVLDSDMLCFKPTTISDFISNGRALSNSYESRGICTREEWWESAEKVLNMNINPPTYFGVTPAWLATDVVKSMRKRIEEVHNEEWSSFLLKNVFTYSFTEYTLYYVYAVSSGVWPEYHISGKNLVYNHEMSVWFDSEFGRFDLNEIVSHAPYHSGHFVVVQSNTHIPASEVTKKMGALFD